MEREIDKESKQEANLAEVEDDEPALLLAKCDKYQQTTFLLDEKKVLPKLGQSSGKKFDSNLWYLDNGASNHMM